MATLARRIARISRYYIQTLAEQLRAVVSFVGRCVRRLTAWLWRIYCEVETSVGTVVADLLLLGWAIRTALALLLVEGILIYFSIRWPMVWVAALTFGIFILTAAIQTFRELRGGAGDGALDIWPRARPFLIGVVRGVFRLTIAGFAAFMSYTYFLPHVERIGPQLLKSVSRQATRTATADHADATSSIQPSE